MRRWDAANCSIGLFVSPLPYKIILTYGRGNSKLMSFPMHRKLMHSPIAFAELCIKIICANWQFYFNAELIWKLKKKIWLRPSLSPPLSGCLFTFLRFWAFSLNWSGCPMYRKLFETSFLSLVSNNLQYALFCLNHA